jgi:hypothetical protein
VSDEGDRLAIRELLHLHGDLVDEGDFGGMSELFADDVVHDVSTLGGGTLSGTQAIADAGRALGEGNPVGHHVTNVVVPVIDGDEARAPSKGLAVMSDGSTGSVVHGDDLCRTSRGWRIARRRVLPGRSPLQPSSTVVDPSDA